ncbi:MAG: M14 metallopeptidase family protein [Acidithiobacillales bacterium]
MKRAVSAAVPLAVCLAISPAASAGGVPSPSEFLGIAVGADRTLADYHQIVSYLKVVEAGSPRVRLEVLGKTTLGQDLVMAVVSSEANLKGLPTIRDTARKLADPRGLSDAEVAGLARDGKAVVLVTGSIHSTEIGASQMAMEWIHALATATDPATLERLSNIVLLIVPSDNPDGQILETEWYRKWLGTQYEGGRMPWLYHPYVGHDNNRDWFMLTQKETKALNQAVVREWHPQVWLDEHQMGPTGPRIFTPPYASPIDPEIHPLVWREINLIGSEMSLRLEQAGKPGVIFGYTFDAYCPGMTESTAWYKNISGLLTEVASARLATPLWIEPGELAGGGTGLVDYGPQANFPLPWPGGWWHLRDIMDYERIVSDALLETCSAHREDLLRDVAARARAAVAAAAPGDAFVIPAAQRDPASARRLAALMVEHGVEVRQAPGGDVYIPLAQPYGLFVKSLLSYDRYPEVKLVPGKEIIRPYDVTAWTLPMMMGVEVRKATLPDSLKPWTGGKEYPPTAGPFGAISSGSPESARVVNAALRSGGGVAVATKSMTCEERSWPAGTVFLDETALRAAEPAAAAAGVLISSLSKNPLGVSPLLVPLRAPRVGLYKPWTASVDEGWTRWILEQYGFAPKSLDNKAIRRGKLRESFDVVILPDLTPERISTGKPKREEGEMRYFAELPPEYQGGLEKEGAKALVEFVEAGGTLVALADSSDWVIAEFNIPVRNVLAKAKKEEFLCPGSLLEVRLGQEHPVTWGLPKEMPIFVDGSMAFQTVPPGQELRRWDLASYPDAARDVLLSGWIHGAEKLTRRSAAVAMTYGKGKLVLLGFRPQFRAWTSATFPFLFNALFWSVEEGQPSGPMRAR